MLDCRIVLSMFVLSCLVPVPSDAQLGLTELIELHTQARGGRHAIEAVENIEVELRIEEPSFLVDGLYRADREQRMRIDIFSDGERVFSEGLDGSAGWQWKGGATHAEAINSAASDPLRHGAILNLLGLHELEEAGHALRYLGVEELDGVEFHLLEITLDDGFVRYDYLDPTSYLVARSRSFRAFHPDLDPEKKWHETRFSEFRAVEGCLRAFVQETVDLTTGETIATVETRAIRVNVDLDPGIFNAP